MWILSLLGALLYICYLAKCVDCGVNIYYSLPSFLYAWSAWYWRRFVKVPPGWLLFCLFLLFILSSIILYSKAMFWYLPWILISVISLLRAYHCIIMKISSLTKLAHLSLKSDFCDLAIATAALIVSIHIRACLLSHFSHVQLFAVDCNQPGSSVHGILQARILEWIAIPSSRRSSWSRDWTHVSYVSYTGRWVLYH